jgi:hypothetical protein
MLVLGKPGRGKTHGALTIADMCDNRGPIFVDCGDRYMGDLLWEQVIDYGQSFKPALIKKIKEGRLSSDSIRIFNEELPGVLVRSDGDMGHIVGIDWDKATERRKLSKDTDEKERYESSVEATDRVMEIIKKVAVLEDIPTQAVNSVGLKKVPGLIKRIHDEGLTGILDEYTKSEEGSDGGLQNVLQYFSGGVNEVTITNPMRVDGEVESYTLRREDMRAGAFIYMTGNNEDDGVTTHGLPASVYSRVLIAEVLDPLPTDWKQFIGRQLTGLPVSTICSLFPDVVNNPDEKEEFGGLLREMRILGLSQEQTKQVPEYELTLLTHWKETRAAIDKLADFYRFWARIIDQDSDLYDTQNAATYKAEVEDIRSEIMGDYAQKHVVDFRKVIRDVADSLRDHPTVRKIGSGTGLRFNLAAVGKKAHVTAEDPEAIAAELGTHLSKLLYNRVCAVTQGKPRLQAILLKEGYDRGIFPPDTPIPGQQTIITLLDQDQDQYKAAGGIKNVIKLRSALASRLKRSDSSLKGKPDGQVVSMGEAAQACTELASLTVDEEAPKRDNRLIILGKDLGHMFNQAAAVDNDVLKAHGIAAPEADELVSVSDFLDSLRIPAIANANIQGIWPRDNAAGLRARPPEETPKGRENVQSVLNALEVTENSHSSKIGMQALIMQGEDGEKVPVHVVYDQTRNKALIVTEKADAATRAALSGDFTVLTYDDENLAGRITAFVNETLGDPSRPSTEEAVTQIEKALTWAFSFLVSGYDADNVKRLDVMMARRESEEHHVKTPIFLYKKAPKL